MNRKTLIANATQVLAHRNRNGYHRPMRLIDTRMWRRDSGYSGNAARYAVTTATRFYSNHNSTTGYAVLSIATPGALTNKQFDAALTVLTEVDMHGLALINDDGTLNRDAIPKCLTIDIINNRTLTATWTDHRDEKQANADAYIAARAAKEAEWAAGRVAAATAAHDALMEKTRVEAAKKAQSDVFVDQLGTLGVNDMITMVSEHSVMMDVRTLTALIAMANDQYYVDPMPMPDMDEDTAAEIVEAEIVHDSPAAPIVDPDTRYVNLISLECRLCHQRSPWEGRDTAWEVDHYATEHPGTPVRDWSTYRWGVTRNIPRYM